MTRRIVASKRSRRIVLGLALLGAAAMAGAPGTRAQTAPQQPADDQQLEALLTGAEVFYKKAFNEEAQRWEYQVAWSRDGETSMLNIYLRSFGTRGDGSKLFTVYAWTQVTGAPQGQQLPPEVIKAVAAINDGLYSGNISTSGSGVFANTGFFMQDLTADALWFYLYDLHDNRVNVKRQLDQIVAGG